MEEAIFIGLDGIILMMRACMDSEALIMKASICSFRELLLNPLSSMFNTEDVLTNRASFYLPQAIASIHPVEGRNFRRVSIILSVTVILRSALSLGAI